MRKALVCGISHYENYPSISGCVNDAIGVKNVIERHGDGRINFGVKLLVGRDESNAVSRNDLKNQIEELFSGDSDIALLYFSGHGHLENSDGYLATSECKDGDDGVSISEIVTLANKSQAREKIIILDCCHSGIAGSLAGEKKYALISEGLCIITAAEPYQFAVEKNGSGVFTKLLIEALSGGAANVLGNISVGDIYAYVDRSLGAWQQRPLFRLNLKTFSAIREVSPAIDIRYIKSLVDLFETPDSVLYLDPSYESSSENAIVENLEKFEALRKLSRINLVKTSNDEQLYFTAMNSGSCCLTERGKHFHTLVSDNLI